MSEIATDIEEKESLETIALLLGINVAAVDQANQSQTRFSRFELELFLRLGGHRPSRYRLIVVVVSNRKGWDLAFLCI
jgi:hypothetical protein